MHILTDNVVKLEITDSRSWSDHAKGPSALKTPGEADGAVALNEIRVGLLAFSTTPTLHNHIIPFILPLRKDVD